MNLIKCKQCGGGEFYQENGYMVCKFCESRYAIEPEDIGKKESHIGVKTDVENLLEKCKTDPTNARKYANLVLDIDPNNIEALKYL